MNKLNRRSVLKLAGLSAVSVSHVACAKRFARVQSLSADKSELNIFNAEEFITLKVVQEHFLPSDIESPGAREFNSTRYLELALTGSDIDPKDILIIREGAKSLQDLSIKHLGLGVASLNNGELETLLRQFEETTEGNNWLKLLMSYTLESFLGDPAYGGNTDELGWRYVGHTPGVPRPIKINAENRR